MKALTIRQPWAWAIAHADKRIENRTRRTNFRGTFYIHAGLAGVDWQALIDVDTRLPIGVVAPREGLVYGALIATAELVDCVFSEKAVGLWGEPQAWHWILDKVKPFKTPVPAKGQLGLWEYTR